MSTDELTGAWEIYSYGSEELPFHQYDFGADKVTVTGGYINAQIADYTFLDGEIIISSNRWSGGFSLFVDHLAGDTLYLDDGTLLIRTEAGSIWPVYDLPSVSGGEHLPVREKGVQYGVFHFYHAMEDDTTFLRFGDRVVTAQEIPLALYMGHAKRVDVLLFVDRTIAISELHELYLSLAASGVRKVYIVAGQENYDTFTWMKDETHVFYNELEELRPAIPLPPPPPTISREDFLNQPTSQQIDILEVSDTTIVAELPTDAVYLFSIKSSLNMQEYLEIKKCLSSVRKRNRLRFVIDFG